MIIFNGQATEAGLIGSDLLNRSFRYGDGLFESIGVHGGKPSFLPYHLKRLYRGMEVLGFSYPVDTFKQELVDAISRLLQINQIHAHGRLRLHVYRGGEGAYAPTSDEAHYLLEGYALKEDPMASSASLRLTAYDVHRLKPGPLSGLKTANALPYVLAARHARKQGWDEALLFSEQGYLAEASSANIFLVKEKKCQTPPLSTGCVDGVMRHQVMRICQELSIEVQEKNLRPTDLLQADEAFLTNSVRGIIPIGQYEQRLFPHETQSVIPFLRKSLMKWVEQSAMPSP